MFEALTICQPAQFRRAYELLGRYPNNSWRTLAVQVLRGNPDSEINMCRSANAAIALARADANSGAWEDIFISSEDTKNYFSAYYGSSSEGQDQEDSPETYDLVGCALLSYRRPQPPWGRPLRMKHMDEEPLLDQPKALIFDCDGTLADTMPIHFVAWRAAMNRHGLDFPEDRFYAMGGIPTRQIIETLSREQGITVDLMAAAEDKEHAYLELLSHVQPVEPIVAIARAHHGRLPMGVGSGSAKSVMIKTLRHIQVLDLFDCLVGSEDTQQHKPAPDVFLRVAELLGVAPESCLVYEDTDVGIEAARRAGMNWCDVRTVHTPRRVTQA